MDQRIADLRARRMVATITGGRRPRRAKRVPPALPPRGQRLRYQRALFEVLDRLEELVRGRLLPVVERAAAQVQAIRPDALAARLDAASDDIDDVVEGIAAELSGGVASTPAARATAQTVAGDVARHNRRQVGRQFEAVLGVGLPAFEPALDEVLAAFARDNVRLIKNLGEGTLRDIEGVVLRGFRRGRPHREIAKDIQGRFGVARRRARLIARDQVSKLNGELTQVRQTTMGVEEYTWRSSRDERVRDEHAELDGQRFRWDQPPAEGHPGEAVNCRCVAEPVLERLIDEITREPN